ncbi:MULTISPECIES: hypothetical protein [Rhodococcus]|uniref:hypothetical protein n=1 Tax=Rhodococcus TaxID=1827 RepID=UPI000AD41EA1|nr:MULTISPECIES: hypothetical protein [Rhodococcus]QQZ15223.1 hypothetical protein GO592_03160 [Rhodococcus sp. 21391]
MADTTTIPGVSGWAGPLDQRGWLTFKRLPKEMQNAWDATIYNDFCQRDRVRETTPEEIALLRHLRVTVPMDYPESDPRHSATMLTKVTYVTATLRNLSWPALAEQTPTDPKA